jgi:hypothetical protein
MTTQMTTTDASPSGITNYNTSPQHQMATSDDNPEDNLDDNRDDNPDDSLDVNPDYNPR